MSGHTFNSLKKLYPILSHLFPICRNFLTLCQWGREKEKKKRVEGFPFLSFPKFVIGNPNALKTLMDPGLKIAGVTRRWESKCFETRGPLIETFRGDELGNSP